MKKLIRILVSAVLVLSVLSPSVLAAKSVSELKKDMQARSNEMKKIEKQIEAKKDEKEVQVQQKEKLDVQITALLGDIGDIEDVIDEKNREIDKKNGEIETLNQKIVDNTEVLKTRLKVMYEYGNSTYFSLILESKGLSDMFTRIAAVKSILKHDQDLIDSFELARSEVEAAKAVIETEKQEQVEAKSILESKKNELKKLQSEKNAVIASINSDIKELEKAEKKAESDYKSIQAELNKALSQSKSTPAYQGNGKFLWPSAASSRVTSEYGYRIHPISGYKKLHRGLDIGAAAGTNVLAAEAGTVMTAGWNNSYGYYITINHGGGYVTLYAHNSKLLVSKGAKVTKGQVIAKVGSTGNSTGPHIHFEVMVNGTCQNPRNYL